MGTCAELAAATVEVSMLMPLVKPTVLRAAGPDRKAAGSSGFCFPWASARPSETANVSSELTF